MQRADSSSSVRPLRLRTARNLAPRKCPLRNSSGIAWPVRTLCMLCEINSVKFPRSNSRAIGVCSPSMNAETQARLYSREPTGPKLEVLGPRGEGAEEVLTPRALQLLASLHRRFNARRLELLHARARRQALLDDGALPEFLADTAAVRAADWRISPVPADLIDRRVEITGPVDRKMVINALNAPVQAFMADFEDSCSPTWENIIRGQVNLNDAVRRTISYADPATGKVYRLPPPPPPPHRPPRAR